MDYILILAVVFILAWLYYKIKARVDKYEYLDVLSYIEWKSGRVIRNQMGQIKGGWISPDEMYSDLTDLIIEGLVADRIITASADNDIQNYEFKLTDKGNRKRRNKPVEASPRDILEPAVV